MEWRLPARAKVLVLVAALCGCGCTGEGYSAGQGRGGQGNAQWAGEAPENAHTEVGLAAVSGPGKAGRPGGNFGAVQAPGLPPGPVPSNLFPQAPPVGTPPPELLTAKPGPGPGDNSPNSGFPGPGIGMYGQYAKMVAPNHWQVIGWGGAQAWTPRAQCEGLDELERKLETLGHRLPALDNGEMRYRPEQRDRTASRAAESRHDSQLLRAEVDALALRVAELNLELEHASSADRERAGRRIDALYQRVKRMRADVFREKEHRKPAIQAPGLSTLDVDGHIVATTSDRIWLKDDQHQVFELQVPPATEVDHKKKSFERNALAEGDEVKAQAFARDDQTIANHVEIKETPAEQAIRVKLSIQPNRTPEWEHEAE